MVLAGNSLEQVTSNNGWFPGFESKNYFAINLILPFSQTQVPQGCQNIHKYILQMNLMKP